MMTQLPLFDESVRQKLERTRQHLDAVMINQLRDRVEGQG